MFLFSALFLLGKPLFSVEDFTNVPFRFNQLNQAISGGIISETEARSNFSILIPELSDYYKSKKGKPYPRKKWVFPLKAYTPGSSRLNRRDYIYRGFNYFVTNRHYDHPAFDLFIKDKNQDLLDDRNGRYVKVLSMTGGIVVAVLTNWTTNSNLHGGNVVWIYDPFLKGLVYYAHNNLVLAEVGKLVKPGDPIAAVGRTGVRAYEKKSPTHLHISYLKIVSNDVIPLNIYKTLKRCGVKK
jgi:murein DD-endopeptidase MepM/ murein hydrolase activator NlpD